LPLPPDPSPKRIGIGCGVKGAVPLRVTRGETLWEGPQVDDGCIILSTAKPRVFSGLSPNHAPGKSSWMAVLCCRDSGRLGSLALWLPVFIAARGYGLFTVTGLYKDH